jgi:hypothetical protein
LLKILLIKYHNLYNILTIYIIHYSSVRITFFKWLPCKIYRLRIIGCAAMSMIITASVYIGVLSESSSFIII